MRSNEENLTCALLSLESDLVKALIGRHAFKKDLQRARNYIHYIANILNEYDLLTVNIDEVYKDE